ncbi:hypothetical protein AB0C89_11140 [Streptomyces sp. NPDC048491]|uniref:hypothetical protein n=1 Tax=Streptomyces sp. NPDC048491 TaxID=3157207 RepID=UPI00341ED194
MPRPTQDAARQYIQKPTGSGGNAVGELGKGAAFKEHPGRRLTTPRHPMQGHVTPEASRRATAKRLA